MAAWSELSGGARAGLGAGAAAAVWLIAYYVFVPALEPVAPEVPVVAPVTAPVTAPVAAAVEPAKVPQAAVVAPGVAPEVAPVAEAVVAPEVGPVVEALAAPVVEPVAEPVAEAVAVAPEAVVAAQPNAALPAPSLDVVRVDTDGSATVAGRAVAGDAIAFVLEAEQVFATTTDGNGNFVGLFSLPPAEAARVLSVVATSGDGQSRSIEVVVAPFKPVVIAAETAPEVAGKLAEAVPEAPAVLLLAPEGVKVLQPMPLADKADQALIARNVTLDSITYAPDGAVMLGGKGSADATVRVYLDDAAVGEALVGRDGTWALTLGAVGAGIYTLRVDQLFADGTVSSRFETPFKRETPEALAAVLGQAAPQVVAVAPEAGSAPAPEPAPQVSAVSAAPATAAPAALSEPAAAADSVPKTAVSITVQPGFTLWGIAKKEFGNGVMYVQVFDANKDRIKDPDLIYPGQVFLIPGSP